MKITRALSAAYRAFREAYVVSDLQYPDDFNSFDARRLRYAIYWAFYENTAYRTINKWTTKLKNDYALYRWIRNIYNPSYRLGEFYKAHLFGGRLDVDAGPTGAIPIKTDNEAVPLALSEVWKWSNWYSRKDIYTLWGTVLGDVVLEVVDDVDKGRVYLDVLHPGLFENIELDNYGNVRGYTLTYPRDTVTYTEVVYRDGQDVVYETYRNNELYAWNGIDSTWSIPYGFVPMVVVKHNDVGADWGWSELHPDTSKIREADDLASMVTDHIRRATRPQWLMKGMSEPSSTEYSQPDVEDDRPEPERETTAMIWASSEVADAIPMVFNLDLSSSLEHITSVLKELERDYPELRQDIYTLGGNSGRALRVARQSVTSRVEQRRANYDAGMVKANMMALSIGGYRGYFPFTLDSYEEGTINHSVAQRPVFTEDPLDSIEVANKLWEAASKAVQAGATLDGFLLSQGMSQDQINAISGQ
jgi:hypothetical protein